MAEEPAGARRKYQHADPQEALGFTPIPNAVLRRPDVSGLAKAAYALLSDASWQHAEPTEAELGILLGGGEKTARRAISDLVKAGLVTVVRRGQGKTNAYEITPLAEQNGPSGRSSPAAKRGVKNGQNGPSGRSSSANQAVPRADASTQGRTKTTNEDKEPSPVPSDSASAAAPKLVLVDGKNLPFDALAEVCEIDPASNRVGEIAAALATKQRRGAEPLLGIRDAFRVELFRWAERTIDQAPPQEYLEGLLVAQPDRFERGLAEAIRRKAGLYRARLPGAEMTPGALRKWWLDLKADVARRDGGLTPEQIRAMDL